MNEREKLQNGYWRGGEIAGRTFHPLTVDRYELLRAASAEASLEGTQDDLMGTKLALAVYSLTDEEAGRGADMLPLLHDIAKGFGSFPLWALAEFGEYFERDCAATQYSEAGEGPQGPQDDSEEGLTGNEGGK